MSWGFIENFGGGGGWRNAVSCGISSQFWSFVPLFPPCNTCCSFGFVPRSQEGEGSEGFPGSIPCFFRKFVCTFIAMDILMTQAPCDSDLVVGVGVKKFREMPVVVCFDGIYLAWAWLGIED